VGYSPRVSEYRVNKEIRMEIEWHQSRMMLHIIPQCDSQGIFFKDEFYSESILIRWGKGKFQIPYIYHENEKDKPPKKDLPLLIK
jgi:hypothetical protein